MYARTFSVIYLFSPFSLSPFLHAYGRLRQGWIHGRFRPIFDVFCAKVSLKIWIVSVNSRTISTWTCLPLVVCDASRKQCCIGRVNLGRLSNATILQVWSVSEVRFWVLLSGVSSQLDEWLFEYRNCLANIWQYAYRNVAKSCECGKIVAFENDSVVEMKYTWSVYHQHWCQPCSVPVCKIFTWLRIQAMIWFVQVFTACQYFLESSNHLYAQKREIRSGSMDSILFSHPTKHMSMSGWITQTLVIRKKSSNCNKR